MIVSFSWSAKDGRRHQWAQALQIHDGRITDMQDYASPKRATAGARLRALFG